MDCFDFLIQTIFLMLLNYIIKIRHIRPKVSEVINSYEKDNKYNNIKYSCSQKATVSYIQRIDCHGPV